MVKPVILFKQDLQIQHWVPHSLVCWLAIGKEVHLHSAQHLSFHHSEVETPIFQRISCLGHTAYQTIREEFVMCISFLWDHAPYPARQNMCPHDKDTIQHIIASCLKLIGKHYNVCHVMHDREAFSVHQASCSWIVRPILEFRSPFLTLLWNQSLQLEQGCCMCGNVSSKSQKYPGASGYQGKSIYIHLECCLRIEILIGIPDLTYLVFWGNGNKYNT